MSDKGKKRRIRNVGVYDRPRSADRPWLYWLLILGGVVLLIVALWQFLA